MWFDMMQAEMKVGPKGQVVIPKAMRRALKISPGVRVTITMMDERVVIQRSQISAVSVFEAIARDGSSIPFTEPHLYEEELERRLQV
jgi:AbrB family looped-hinge helix DNA binding protein